MFSASEPIMATLRDYMARERFHAAKKLTSTPTEDVFIIMSQTNPMSLVLRADRIAAMFVRRKGRRRERHPISDKRAHEMWHKYSLRFSPRLIKISAEGILLSAKPLSEVEGLS